MTRFIARWLDREGGQERANYGLFLTGLCRLLNLQEPDPADATHENNDYVFERVVRLQRGEEERIGRIDLYKRDCFVLEAKQSRVTGGRKAISGQDDLFVAPRAESQRGRRGAERAWDVLMINAKRQAEDYARALPQSHGWPPFILICDVGHCIEVYADISGQGKNYTQFPDRQNFRIYLEDLRQADVRERLRAIWLDPHSLDPAKKAAKVTRDIAKRLADVSLALEKKNYAPQDVAMFLMRCLFTMFAEDVKLLPENSFTDVLARCEAQPEAFVHDVGQLWEAMDQGGWAHAIHGQVKKFNGEFFRSKAALPLGREEIGELRRAASFNWNDVDPSIFGTLLEQALDPEERKRLGAHYTPRSYVERLVTATIIEPLREDWRNVQAAAETLRASGDVDGAVDEIGRFHHKLCETRVLDPACGTGNFLYVALELMKRLEGEVLEAYADLGGAEKFHALDRHNVDPHQFLGIEINPRAAAIAELVLWIGYLQWHFRTRGSAPSEPILRAFRNIQVRNAVLTWDGEPVPVIVDGGETYPSACRPEWPDAEFIVGNPPFIGGGFLRSRLGDAQVEALWRAHPQMNESADFVMYWWDHAAESLAQKGSVLRRFGLITTNSISQVFQRRVVERHLRSKNPISLVLAVPDHPWTKATKDAAAVRIAMTVAQQGAHSGTLLEVVREEGLDTDVPQIIFRDIEGKINADLSVGIDITISKNLRAMEGMCSPGVKLHGAGFIVTPEIASHLGLGRRPGLEKHIRPYRNGRDLTGRPRNVTAIDLFGLDIASVRARFPEVYQHLVTAVKPERDINKRTSYRDCWWIFGEPRRELRPALAGLSRFIATVETTKHRVFQFLDSDILPDNMILAIASDDAFHLGVLSSRIHSLWALRAGGWLGVGNDPRYSKSRCFDPFPFPACTEMQMQAVRDIAEQLDAHRKHVLAEHPHLTLTGLYNVLEKLRAGTQPANLDTKDRQIFDDGLVLILKEYHDRLDAAVADAYGWPLDVTEEDVLARLVALNAERAAEEQRGLIRWLRPDYQIPRFAAKADAQEAAEQGSQVEAALQKPKAAAEKKPSFPSDPVEQTAAIFAAFAAAKTPLGLEDLAAQFRKSKTSEERIGRVLMSLERLGHVVAVGDAKMVRYLLRRAA